jgi:hypothetical protein
MWQLAACNESVRRILLRITVCHADGEDTVSLSPGANVLRFTAAPVKAGLYAARGIAAQLGNLRLALPLLPPVHPRSSAVSWPHLSGEDAQEWHVPT